MLPFLPDQKKGRIEGQCKVSDLDGAEYELAIFLRQKETSGSVSVVNQPSAGCMSFLQMVSIHFGSILNTK